MEINTSNLKLIYNILTTRVETRDDWLLMLQMVHNYELKQYNIEKTQYYEALFEKRILTNVHTIIRYWRKVQQENEHLRGEKWDERQQESNNFRKNYKQITQYEYCLFSDDDLENMTK
jgi:hypothetical protein